ncbi:glycoside hydrolase family 43 protein [Agarivorans sp. MS3-6]
MATITNPILTGFRPDPSIIRVGDDYYIATSTFEWFPGIMIHHSKDMVNWKIIGHVLNTAEHLDMRGMDNSEGVYAPALSYADGKFWCCFSNVHSCRGGTWMSTPAYVVSAEDIKGPWSKPVSIGNYGFDPSLFHDDDGKKYMLNMVWDGRKNTDFFGGIILQEFDPEKGQLVGDDKIIFEGTKLGCTEGPQILKKDGWYYLITAEGGTSYDHAVTVCRAKNVWGPYEVHPHNPILTSRHQDDAELQRAGHGFLVETQNNEWFLSHLCGRPIADPDNQANTLKYGQGRCTLGRETALQNVEWRDNWPYVVGGTTPRIEIQAPKLAAHPWAEEASRDDFEHAKLAVKYQSLKDPFDESWFSLTQRLGYARLVGRDYLYSRYNQSLLAQRLTAFNCISETAVEFEPKSPRQMAGLVAYYSRGGHYFLKTSANDAGQQTVQLVGDINDEYQEYTDEILVGTCQRIYMRLELDTQWYQFSYSLDGSNWQKIGPTLNATFLSDEGSGDIFRFTGSLLGLFACDLTGKHISADFDYFEYKVLD